MIRPGKILYLLSLFLALWPAPVSRRPAASAAASSTRPGWCCQAPR